MSKLFEEEQDVLDALLAEWYEEIKSFTQGADGIFSEKGKMYDRTSPVWERIRFPHGFVQELRKKTDRVDQLLEGYEEGKEVRWEEVSEELGDIFNYSRMFGSLITMYLSREKGDCSNPYLHQTNMTTAAPHPDCIKEEADAMRQGIEVVEDVRAAERQPKDYLNGKVPLLQVNMADLITQADRPKTIHEMQADAVAYVDYLDKCREEEEES